MRYVAGSICPNSYLYHVLTSGYMMAGRLVDCEICGQPVRLTGLGRYRKHVLKEEVSDEH